MTHNTPTRQQILDILRYVNRQTTGAVLVLLIVTFGGCKGKAPQEIPPVKTEAVTVNDITLDENAEPEQVAYALLQLMKEDVEAAQAFKPDEQKEALHKTFALAAHSHIARHVLGVINQTAPVKQDELEDKGERIFAFVRQWAAIVGHYVRSFEEDPQAAMNRMRLVGPNAEGEMHVYYSAEHDPAETDPEKKETAVVDILLAREQGADGNTYWRLARVDFRRPATQPARVPTTQPVVTEPTP